MIKKIKKFIKWVMGLKDSGLFVQYVKFGLAIFKIGVKYTKTKKDDQFLAFASNIFKSVKDSVPKEDQDKFVAEVNESQGILSGLSADYNPKNGNATIAWNGIKIKI